MEKIHLKKLKDLNFKNRNLNSISAASGLVKNNDLFYVIADDEFSLAMFSIQDSNLDTIIPLITGSLPSDNKLRKKLKPDWESLVYISSKYNNALLAVPSGSEENRRLGILANIEDINSSKPTVRAIDFTSIYEELSKTLKSLNIEGACITNDSLKLFQRGNGINNVNAIIDLNLAGTIDDLENSSKIAASRIEKIQTFELGSISECSYGFTDACSVGENIYFLAVAEDTQSTYDDGTFKGAYLGCMNLKGEIFQQADIPISAKPEGLWIEKILNETFVYMVTDADNREQVAGLYSGRINF